VAETSNPDEVRGAAPAMMSAMGTDGLVHHDSGHDHGQARAHDSSTLALPLPRVAFCRKSTPRPTALGPAERLAAARKFAQHTVEFRRSYFSDCETLVEQFANDIVAQSRFSDGYEMAKALESRAGWKMDAEMVELLDGWQHCERAALQAAVERWAARVEIPTLPTGTIVSQIEHDYCRSLTFGAPGLVGEIHSLQPKNWTYYVRPEDGPENSFVVVAVEDMVAAQRQPSCQPS
jgi:hypothetical protein